MKDKKDKDQLKFENELKKMKLKAERGADFMEFPNSEEGASGLPPEVEAQWLDQIMAFENAHDDAKTIKISDRLGKPAFKPVADLTDAEVSNELDRAMELMAKHNMALDTICDVEERELYRFIVEEFLDKEMDDMHVPGMTTHFTYEEYYPNHEYDIHRHLEDFLNTLFTLKDKYFDMVMASEVITHDNKTLNEVGYKLLLKQFMDSFESMELEQLEFKQLTIDEENAVQEVYLKYKGQLKDNQETVVYKGKGRFSFINEYDYWCVNGVDMPGLRL